MSILSIALFFACQTVEPSPLDRSASGSTATVETPPPDVEPATDPSGPEGGIVSCSSDLDPDAYVHRLWVDLDTGAAEIALERAWAYDDAFPAPGPGVVWTGLAEEPAGSRIVLPVGEVALASRDALGMAVLYAWDTDGADVELVCWHEGLPDRVGHEPLPAFPSTLGAGCPAPGNDLPLPFVRATGVGRCADLAGAALNGDDLYYGRLEGYDLRGADLTHASLFFANLLDARLEGTRLGDIDYGYARVEGLIDDATEIPTEGACTVDGQRLACVR